MPHSARENHTLGTAQRPLLPPAVSVSLPSSSCAHLCCFPRPVIMSACYLLVYLIDSPHCGESAWESCRLKSSLCITGRHLPHCQTGLGCYFSSVPSSLYTCVLVPVLLKWFVYLSLSTPHSTTWDRCSSKYRLHLKANPVFFKEESLQEWIPFTACDGCRLFSILVHMHSLLIDMYWGNWNYFLWMLKVCMLKKLGLLLKRPQKSLTDYPHLGFPSSLSSLMLMLNKLDCIILFHKKILHLLNFCLDSTVF